MTLLEADTIQLQGSKDPKIEQILWYVSRGWKVFPTTWLKDGWCSCGDSACKSPGKHPLTPNGFKDATLHIDTIETWHAHWPHANWATSTGDGFAVVDIDNHPEKGVNGFPYWYELREKHSEPLETVTVRTGGEGLHLYFRYPLGTNLKSKIAPGVDVKSDGGYVLLPPSVSEKPYTFEFSPIDVEVAEMPEWILELAREPETEPIKQTNKQKPEINRIIRALDALKQERVDDYESWVSVGMALHASGLGEDALALWDKWSEKSKKYEPGICAKKWKSFSNDAKTKKLTLASLYLWAKQDGQRDIPAAPQHPKPSDYVAALESFGYEFSLNEMNDQIYVNGAKMNDALMAGVEFDLRDNGYKNEKDTAVSIYKMASDRPFHPVRDYLNGLIAEGKIYGQQIELVDHIGRLASFFEDKDGIFPVILRKWLIGAVGRILGADEYNGPQHPALVLDGAQGIGKSHLAWWLGSPLPAFYLQSPINTNDKDFLIMLCSKFIWEIVELGATLRKADIESLKGFLTHETVNVRKPYGRSEITKPATASFIGTINNNGGFLADPTGHRRYWVCTLTKIDWAYEHAIDVNQVWAQAVALYEQGERWQLDSETNKRVVEINGRYEVDDPLHYDLINEFDISPLDKEQFIATTEIIKALRDKNKIVGGNDTQIAQRITTILTKLGCEKVVKRVYGHQARGWSGVSPRM